MLSMSKSLVILESGDFINRTQDGFLDYKVLSHSASSECRVYALRSSNKSSLMRLLVLGHLDFIYGAHVIH